MKPKRIGVVMDPLESIRPEKDTTLALMLEAQSRDIEVVYMTLGDLSLNNDRAEGFMRVVTLHKDRQSLYELVREGQAPLSDLDLILMRKDPPFDMEFIMATYILEHAAADGVRVINDPKSLRDFNEKVCTAWFPQCCPPGLLSRSIKAILSFLDEHGKIVVKPTCRMGGQSIFVIEKGDPNNTVIVEEMTAFGTRFIQAQKFIPDIATAGDKRILLIDGVPAENAFTRIPAANDHRGNLAAGAVAKPCALTDRDRWICSQIAPTLRERGLFFVGIDVIGEYLTEINVTSPTGVRELEKLTGINVPSMFFDALYP